MTARLLVALVVAVTLSGCAPSGITGDAASAIVRREYAATTSISRVEWVAHDRVFRAGLTGLDGTRDVWIVVAAGAFPGECAAGAACPDVPSGRFIVDAISGEVLQAEFPAP